MNADKHMPPWRIVGLHSLTYECFVLICADLCASPLHCRNWRFLEILATGNTYCIHTALMPPSQSDFSVWECSAVVHLMNLVGVSKHCCMRPICCQSGANAATKHVFASHCDSNKAVGYIVDKLTISLVENSQQHNSYPVLE